MPLKYKSFSSYLLEETKDVVFTFGRFNPPTIGHEKLINKVASLAKGNNYRIYSSHSQDAKKNPLDHVTKTKFMRKMFPKHGRNIIMDHDVKNAIDVLVKLYEQGFTKVTMVVGSDRVNEFSVLTNKYNGVKARHGFYNFENGVNVISAGERDPDADDVSGMSASKMRAAATDNNFSEFSKGLPSGFKDGKVLFDTIRKSMGIKEASDYHKHIQLQPISNEREAFIRGELFENGDDVILKESDEVGKIVMLGANYVLVELHDGRKLRKWLKDVEKLEEKKKNYGIDLDVDSDVDNLEKSVPDELSGTDKNATKKMFKKYDKEKLHTKIGVAYEKNNLKQMIEMSKSTKSKRDAEFQKRSKMSDDDPRAYKQDIPGDANAKTIPSKHTKKFKDMFGEEILKEGNPETSLRKKSDQTGISYGILKQVFDRGVAAWKTGHRPGTTPIQWGLARVNSFATGGKTRTTADADLWKQHKE